jgi:hypothetical protein
MNIKQLTLTVCLFLVQISFSQSFLSTNGRAIVNESGDTIILRTMNLGGWMLIEPYQIQAAGSNSAQWELEENIEALIGTAEKDIFLENWYANHCKKVDIDSLASWGFNCIRLPMHYNLYTLSIQEEPVAGENTWLDKGFEMTDSLVSWCKQNNMYVILDLHAAPGGQGANTGISDYNPSLPSLWESEENQNKTIALWKKLAERYVDEPAIAGYDYLNETNWGLGTNVLRNFYVALTDTIRQVDDKHIIFIEGNGYANDFSGLTPPWDDNLVYSPHKYWSKNFQADIQWVLDIRNTYNVPIWFGESGENSNTWFRNAIRLFEDFDMGWAWWPMKKIESISCPMSVNKSSEYQSLLNYWDGNGSQPSSESVINTLYQLTEDLKLENCTYQKDVIDAMFRQVYSNETNPFDTIPTIPGRVFATKYDIGIVGQAYQDNIVSDFHVSTGVYTAWNNGWMYRNDGVDISKCNDIYIFHNGFHVGWFETGEWLQYTVNVENDAVYDIKLRYATANPGSKLHFANGDQFISPSNEATSNNNWTVWQTLTFENIILESGIQKLRLYCDNGEINVNSFEIIEKGEISTINANYLNATTVNPKNIELLVNKPISSPIPSNVLANPNNYFTVHLNSNNATPIQSLSINENNPQIINIKLFNPIPSFSNSTGVDTEISISYNGNDIIAEDGTNLANFEFENVINNLSCSENCIPGTIQAENFFYNSGVATEGCTDIGGGENIGYLDVGDYVDYNIYVNPSGSFKIDYRNASDGHNGGIELQLIDESGNTTTLQDVSFNSTGGWQTWQTSTGSPVIWLDTGAYHMRVLITEPQFNLNWISFDMTVNEKEINKENEIKAFPNPTNDIINFSGFNQTEKIKIEILDITGRLITTTKQEKIDISNFPDGLYIARIIDGDSIEKIKILKK